MVSAILNIVGLAAAFAALYIILVQVHHDLTYNKALSRTATGSMSLPRRKSTKVNIPLTFADL